jgi:hypothetical protein
VVSDFASVHRPKVEARRIYSARHRRPVWYYVAVCECGARTPWLGDWPAAMLAALTHVHMTATRARMVDDEVERFRAQLDAGRVV